MSESCAMCVLVCAAASDFINSATIIPKRLGGGSCIYTFVYYTFDSFKADYMKHSKHIKFEV